MVRVRAWTALSIHVIRLRYHKVENPTFRRLPTEPDTNTGAPPYGCAPVCTYGIRTGL